MCPPGTSTRAEAAKSESDPVPVLGKLGLIIRICFLLRLPDPPGWQDRHPAGTKKLKLLRSQGPVLPPPFCLLRLCFQKPTERPVARPALQPRNRELVQETGPGDPADLLAWAPTPESFASSGHSSPCCCVGNRQRWREGQGIPRRPEFKSSKVISGQPHNSVFLSFSILEADNNV